MIKPDVEDSLLYLSFLPTGHVQGKSGLDESTIIKANETIRVLNLDSPRLKNLRAKKIAEYQMQYLALNELSECSDLNNLEDKEFLDDQLKAFNINIYNDEYYTAVVQNTLG